MWIRDILAGSEDPCYGPIAYKDLTLDPASDLFVSSFEDAKKVTYTVTFYPAAGSGVGSGSVGSVVICTDSDPSIS